MSNESPERPAIRCRGLVKRYADVTAVDGLDLEVLPGECFGLLGPNGAGKTTTIEILEGLLEPDAGDVQILGLRWRDNERELRQRLGVQLQETQLAEKLTVEETLRLFRSFYHRGRIIAIDTPKALVAALGAPRTVVQEGTLEDVFMSLTGRHLRDE